MTERTAENAGQYYQDVGLTFGGSGMDRAAHNRSRAAEIALDPSARILPLWRGKPLLSSVEARDRLAHVGAGHAVLDAAGEPPIFLGRDGHVSWFTCDISDWVPEEGPAQPEDGFLDRTVQIHPALSGGHGFVELRACMTFLSPREAELAATARALIEWHRRHRFCANCGAPTDHADGGWQRLCDACGARHFPRTDPVVIMAVTKGNAMLVGRSPAWPDRMYSLLAGFVEPGETIEGAVRREVFEETGIRVGAVDYVVSQPWPFPASLMIACHGTALNDDIRTDPAEIADAQWVTRERMLEVHAGRDPGMTAARQGAVARFVIERWLAGALRTPRPWS